MKEFVTEGMFLLALSSVLTGLIVEAIKKLKDVEKPNIVAAIVSVIVGLAVSVGWVLISKIAVSVEVILFVIALIVLSWLCSMLGYDKVIQTIAQILGKNKEV